MIYQWNKTITDVAGFKRCKQTCRCGIKSGGDDVQFVKPEIAVVVQFRKAFVRLRT